MAALTFRSLSLLLLAVILNFPTGATSISSREYDSMQRVLRSHGYNLICNAMATSDLQYEILTLPPNASFTLFAPTDASLFALDMIQTASSYVETLRLHLIPLRLSISDLRSISSGSNLPTLLPHTALRLTIDPLQVAGVDVTLPGIFYSRRVAVHGLAGILGLAYAVSYGPNLQASSPVASGGADTIVPLETESNRTDLSPAATPPSVAVAPSANLSNGSAGADLSPVGAESLVSTAGPPSPIPRNNISPASDQSASASPPSASSVPERARVLLMETTEDNSDSEGGEISELLETVGKLKKCGPSDEMTIDCIVADEDEVGLQQLSLQRLLRARA